MTNKKSHLTAIIRNKVSRPMRELASKIIGPALDYGCGRGFDADHFNMDKYDPHYFPEVKAKKYKTITCNYVLNVVDLKTAADIIIKVRKLLRKNGTAYFTVRRDSFKEGFNSKGTFQRFVTLSWPIVKEVPGAYVIYEMKGLK